MKSNIKLIKSLGGLILIIGIFVLSDVQAVADTSTNVQQSYSRMDTNDNELKKYPSIINKIIQDKSEDYGALSILTAVFASILGASSVLISAGISYLVLRRQNKILNENVTREQKLKWMNNLRQLISQYLAVTQRTYAEIRLIKKDNIGNSKAPKKSDEELSLFILKSHAKDFENIETLKNQIILHLGYGRKDAEIEEIVIKIDDKFDPIKLINEKYDHFEECEQLVKIVRKRLSKVWKKVK